MRISHFRRGEEERELAGLDDVTHEPGEDELLWVDLTRDDPALQDAIAALGMTDAEDRLRQASVRPELLRHDGTVIVSAFALRSDAERPATVAIDVAARGNAVLTVRDGPVAGLDDTLVTIRGRTEVGSLDAASFVAVLLDEILDAYFVATEEIEREIDAIDVAALRATPDEKILDRLLDVRRRIAALRRALAPHRPMIAALSRPDVGLVSDGTEPWPGLVDRLQRAIEAVENARELLVGSFEIVMARTSQRTNDIMRVLTVVSVTLLPAGVIAGIFGMNFHADLFDVPGLFWPMVGAITLLCVAILATARYRRWL